MDNTVLWIVFGALVVPLLALDLGVFHRHAHVVGRREAIVWSAIWVLLALVFAVGVFYVRGAERGIEFVTGYLIEKSLSVDNVFLFAVVFRYLAVPAVLEHRLLFWGVLGAIVMRAIMIALGAALISRFHGVLYVFGAFLIFTGIRMYVDRNKEPDPAKNRILIWLRKHIRITENYVGGSFFTRIDGVRYATPLFLALVLVEITDLVFAVDSIPAIFAVTSDPFVVFTSNVFAILGLRALYFLLADVIGRFHYLKVGLAGVLVFVGVKMLLPVKPHALLSLGVVVTILTASIVASLLLPAPTKEEHAAR